ncbi:Acetylxylan esterase precursor [Gimesia alba]|uniref:Acetylxylan esterase n=1 Tax=Gimesia alba TaxID=2527973 RepID=A0A517RCE5_9PLAN|nr:alpha/beta hydrolase [Gimesia alba]QDT41567.1 Acetylxylan esterase precursor [Gimesia alba]
MRRFTVMAFLIVGMCASLLCSAEAREPDAVIDIWPSAAPGETTRHTGTKLARRANENPPATRVKDITRPQLQVFQPPADKRNGVAVLIFPGGGYNYVVTDKEGSEAAEWLNELGITAFVVHYRTKQKSPSMQKNAQLPPASERPLQDGQRALSLVRQRAAEWGVKPDRIGVIGFSAGGQAAALVTTRFDERSYKPNDAIDQVSCRPDFSLLVYPWRLVDDKTGALNEVFTVSKLTPPTFLVHAHNDGATPLSSILFYTALKKIGVGSELHIYETGGHGYGMRPVENSDVDTWTDRAEDWLRQRSLTSAKK